MFSAASFLLAAAISFDSFLAGVSYGCAKIRVPFRSLAISGSITAVMMATSMVAGTLLAQFALGAIAKWLGGALLVFMGALALSHKNGDSQQDCKYGPCARSEQSHPYVELSIFGLLVHVIREPRAADMDRSSIIDSREAVALGLALAMDSFGVGLGSALAGFDPVGMTILAGLACPISLAFGSAIGASALTPNWPALKRLPPWVLITIGLFRFL